MARLRKLSVFPALALVATLSAPPAGAAAVRYAAQTSPWQGGIVSRGDGGARYCAIEARFDNGITLSIAEARADEVTLVMKVKGIKDAKGGDTWPVTIMADSEAKPVTAQAIEAAAAGTIIAMPYGNETDFGAHLATLSVIAKRDRADFRLNALPAAISALKGCVTHLSDDPTWPAQ